MTSGPENPYGQGPDRPDDEGLGGPYGPPPPGQPYGQPYGAPYGQPGYPHPGYVPAPPTDSLALGAMITGIAALVMSCAYGIGLLASPVALVLGRVAMKRIDRSQGQVGGRGFAVAGFVLGIIGTVLLVLAVGLLVVVLVLAGRGAFDGSSTFLATAHAALPA